MSTAAWMLGDPGRTPFSGHLRTRIERGGAWLCAAGRLASSGSLDQAWAASRCLSQALEGAVRQAAGGDRYGLLRAVWQAVAALEPQALGPERGADLSLLLVAGDAAGTSVAGVGLVGAWGKDDNAQWRALVEPGHPLLGPCGRPAAIPGVLELELRCGVLIGVPSHLEPQLPAPAAIGARCGVHP